MYQQATAVVGSPLDVEFSQTGGDATSPNDPTVRVSIGMPQGQLVRALAFFMGHGKWCLRFSPPVLGEYHYHVEAPADVRLCPAQGTFRVVASTPSVSRCDHAVIRVSDNRRHLCREDGTPFFWLADTWWYGATGRCPWPSVFKYLANDRVKKGFTVIQIVLGIPPEVEPDDPVAANEGGPPFKSGWRINPGYFEYADKRIQYLVEVGLVPCIVGGWGHHIDWMGVEAMTKFWKYLVARYAAYPVVWCLSGESEIHLPENGALLRRRHLLRSVRNRVKQLLPHKLVGRLRAARRYVPSTDPRRNQLLRSRRDAWEQVGQIVSQADSSKHIITTHPVPGSYSHTSLNDARWVGLTAIQSGHSRDSAYSMLEHVLGARVFQPRRPIINMEPWYEGILDDFWEEDQRYAIWVCLLAGAAGHTYGAHGVWQMSAGDGPFLSHWGPADWQQAHQYPGSQQMGIAKDILSRVDWWNLVPQFDRISPRWARQREWLPLLAQTSDALVAYFPCTRELFRATIRNLDVGRQYMAHWIDPRTGEGKASVRVNPTERGIWQVAPRPSLEDWVLMVYRDSPQANFSESR